MSKHPHHALCIQTKVLGVGLGAEKLDALVGEESDGGGVLLQGTRGEPLVRDVEEGNVVLGLDVAAATLKVCTFKKPIRVTSREQPFDFEMQAGALSSHASIWFHSTRAASRLDGVRDLVPLVDGRIHSRGVVRASVQDEHGTLGVAGTSCVRKAYFETNCNPSL